MNTKKVTDKTERKKIKRAARKKAAPKPKRASGVARGSMKKRIRHQAQGQRKRSKTVKYDRLGRPLARPVERP